MILGRIHHVGSGFQPAAGLPAAETAAKTEASMTIFNLLPAVYRIKDAQLAQSRNLLTPAESAQLQSLQALSNPSRAQQQKLAQFTAKAARGPLQSRCPLIDEQPSAGEPSSPRRPA
jgi:hypothetical protein